MKPAVLVENTEVAKSVYMQGAMAQRKKIRTNPFNRASAYHHCWKAGNAGYGALFNDETREVKFYRQSDMDSALVMGFTDDAK